MSELLPPRTALITGAARRIGRAIALDLAANGFDVAIHCHRSRAAADALAAAIGSDCGVRAAVIEADLADPVAAGRIMAAATEALGPIGVLVNNASIFERDTIAAFTAEGWHRHMSVNATAPMLLARDFAALLPAGQHGLIVNIIDQRVWKPVPDFFSYSASKAALWWTTRTLAQALAPRIRVMAIGPGPTLKATRQSQQHFDRQVAATPLGVTPALEAFGRTVRYCHASPALTGQMIALDGGQHLAWRTADVVGIDEGGG